LVAASLPDPCEDAVVGLDGGYVRARHQRPERNFEIVAGKVLDGKGNATRFAFVRNGCSEAANAAGLALRRRGVNDNTSVTVLTDGDAGLRAIHRQVAPQGELVLDWFHVSMRFQHLKQLAKGINGVSDGTIRGHALAELERGKWRFWHGQTVKVSSAWCISDSGHELTVSNTFPRWGRLGRMLLDTIRYLEFNADSMPNYGERYRGRLRISTGFAESAVNEIIAKRMSKKQKMRWNRHTVQRFLEVRIHVLNGTLEDAFRHWHQDFRPPVAPTQFAASA
jgi:hypothetical protein